MDEINLNSAFVTELPLPSDTPVLTASKMDVIKLTRVFLTELHLSSNVSSSDAVYAPNIVHSVPSRSYGGSHISLVGIVLIFLCIGIIFRLLSGNKKPAQGLRSLPGPRGKLFISS